MGQNFAETALLAIGSGLNSLGSILLAGWTDFQPESFDGELFYAFFYQNRFQLLLGSWLAGCWGPALRVPLATHFRFLNVDHDRKEELILS